MLAFGVDESYRLEIGDVAALDAATVFGALRGLETFVQLAINPGAADPLSVPAACSIKDAPRFAYRGMMMDCRASQTKHNPLYMSHFEKTFQTGLRCSSRLPQMGFPPPAAPLSLPPP